MSVTYANVLASFRSIWGCKLAGLDSIHLIQRQQGLRELRRNTTRQREGCPARTRAGSAHPHQRFRPRACCARILGSQLLQYQDPSGDSFKPMQFRWNHSILQSGASHPIIFIAESTRRQHQDVGEKVTRESRGDATHARDWEHVPLRMMVGDRSNTASGPLPPPRLRTRLAPACRRRPARVSACCPLAPPPPAPDGAPAAPPEAARSAAASRIAVERRLVPVRARRCAAVAPAFAAAAAGRRRSSPSVAERQVEEYLVYWAMRRRHSGAGKGPRDGSRSHHRWEFQEFRVCRRSCSQRASRSDPASFAQVREEQPRESCALQTRVLRVRCGSGERAREEEDALSIPPGVPSCAIPAVG